MARISLCVSYPNYYILCIGLTFQSFHATSILVQNIAAVSMEAWQHCKDDVFNVALTWQLCDEGKVANSKQMFS
jgi:hypothetical protein